MKLSQNLQKTFNILLILTSLFLLTPQTSYSKPTLTNRSCKDFLQKWEKKPEKLEFNICEKVEHIQVDRLIASYTVKGKNAIEIEKYLIEEFGMAPLKFVCCGWETDGNQYGIYRDKNGFKFYVTMHSEETLVNRRNNWKEIPKFYIHVKTYLGTI